MGKVYVLPAGVDQARDRSRRRQGAGRHSPGAHARGLARRIREHPGELKKLLRNQAFVAGIGNAYRDEILHAAKLEPFRKRSSLAPEEIDERTTAMRSTLEASVLAARQAGAADVREAGSRSRRGAQPGRRRRCPRCGARITSGDGRRVRDRVLPGLPALSRAPARIGALARRDEDDLRPGGSASGR